VHTHTCFILEVNSIFQLLQHAEREGRITGVPILAAVSN
jgi:hypothetical protein